MSTDVAVAVVVECPRMALSRSARSNFAHNPNSFLGHSSRCSREIGHEICEESPFIYFFIDIDLEAEKKRNFERSKKVKLRASFE